MTTRSTRKVTVTTSSTETPKGMMGSKAGSPRASPLSPTRLSRLQEKAELQGLNDRLASYIDRVRSLEIENSRLNLQVETIQESVTKEVVSMKGLYEQELADARKLLDDTAREKAQLQIDVGKLKSDNEDLRMKLLKKERDLTAAEKALLAAEAQVSELATKLNASEAERRKMTAELRDLREEVGKLSRQLGEAKKQLESETLMRVDLENRCQSLKEELQFKQQIYEQEVTETKKRKQVELSEIDGLLQTEYEAKLSDALKELREQYEDQLRTNRSEVEYLYETKMEEMTKRDIRTSEDSEHLTNSLRDNKRKVQELSSRLSYLEATNQTLEQRVQDLEAQLEGERDSHAAEILVLKEEISRLNEQMSLQLQEYQDLMDIKVALDMEISAYRKLLESEEARLNISISSSATTSKSSSSETPIRRTPLRGKRKRGGAREEEVTRSAFRSSAKATGDIEIEEDCPEGKFVKLRNKSAKDVVIGGYQIIRNAGEAETVYKFHSKAKLPAGESVTVWSCDENIKHEPPTQLVMKNQKWSVADKMTTSLVSASEEMAIRESKWESESYSSSSIVHGETKTEGGVSRLYTGCVMA